MQVEKLPSISSLMFSSLSRWREKIGFQEDKVTSTQVTSLTMGQGTHTAQGTSLPRTPSSYLAPWNSCLDGLKSTLQRASHTTGMGTAGPWHGRGTGVCGCGWTMATVGGSVCGCAREVLVRRDGTRGGEER